MEFVNNVHNQYLEILMQFGVVGFFIYLYFLYGIYKYTPETKEKQILKSITLINMILTGFLAYFWFFLTALYGMLITISTNKNTILPASYNTALTPKIVKNYFYFTIFTYFYGLVQ